MALDHLVRSLDSNYPENDELVKSYMHLIRASDDAYKMAFINVYKDITESLDKIDERKIEQSFPKVNSELLPQLKKIRNEIVHKNSLDYDSSEELDNILANLKLLMKYKGELDELNRTKDKLVQKIELKQNWSKSILIPLIVAIISVLITLLIRYFTK